MNKKIIFGSLVGASALTAGAYFLLREKKIEDVVEEKEEAKIINTKDMVVPDFSQKVCCVKQEHKIDLNDGHYIQLMKYSQNYDEKEAEVVLDVLVKKYPSLTCEIIARMYDKMKVNLSNISKLTDF